jgi:hypothetical protein
MGFHPITGWFGINNVIGWVGFNFPLVFLVGCGMDIKVIRFGYGWEWIGFFAISRPKSRSPYSYAVAEGSERSVASQIHRAAHHCHVASSRSSAGSSWSRSRWNRGGQAVGHLQFGIVSACSPQRRGWDYSDRREPVRVRALFEITRTWGWMLWT